MLHDISTKKRMSSVSQQRKATPREGALISDSSQNRQSSLSSVADQNHKSLKNAIVAAWSRRKCWIKN